MNLRNCICRKMAVFFVKQRIVFFCISVGGQHHEKIDHGMEMWECSFIVTGSICLLSWTSMMVWHWPFNSCLHHVRKNSMKDSHQVPLQSAMWQIWCKNPNICHALQPPINSLTDDYHLYHRTQRVFNIALHKWKHHREKEKGQSSNRVIKCRAQAIKCFYKCSSAW